MALKEEIQKALTELRKDKERKFIQTVDLIVNLRKFDNKREGLNTVIQLPHKIKDKKICAFFEVENKKVKTVTPDKFASYVKDKSKLNSLVKEYDFFIAQASVMPKVATTFGRVLGPAGKMPSPQLGIIINADDKSVEELLVKINNSLKIRTKEPSIKVPIGKQDMKDTDLIENILAIYNTLLKQLPKQKENIKNMKIKFTMTKPQKIDID
jgi:large subunit ribosomal protein L1